MEDDWDLQAVVRSCSSTTTAAAASSSAAVKDSQQDCSNFTWVKEAPEPRKSSSVEDLHELWKPFFNKQQILPVSPLSVLQDLPPEPKQEMKQQQQQQLFSFVNGSKRSATSQNPRSKKRKNHSKKVCHVPAESLSSDTWSWRKYGQKPIKGSPYPRGYYRCSTLKGCMARKQVERNRSDPGMFIVTYTGDHSHPMPAHRNSLAGSTRPKPAPASPEKIEEELMEEEVDEEEDDDFFAGLEDFAGGCSPENQRFPWVAAGGG